MEEHYADEDEVVHMLTFPKPCPIRIDIEDESIRLFVGQRDWEWRRGCPDVLACGTILPPNMDGEEQG
jgi:hypothetical protein